MRLAIDFDETIHDMRNPLPGRRMGAPLPGAKDALDLLKGQGHTIIIFSVRGDSPKHVEDWMRYYEIPFDEVTRTKPDDIAFFIDDHGLRFTGDWDETLAELFKHHEAYLTRKAND